MMMVPNTSITASQPKLSPRGLADADVQCRHMEEAIASSTMDVIPTSDLPPWLRASLPRLLRLCDMNPNWDSYGSLPPSMALVKSIVKSLRLAEKETLPEPKVVPTSSGGIQLEWYLGKRELEIEFTPTGQIEYLRSDNERNEEKEDVIKDLDDLRCLLAWLIG